MKIAYFDVHYGVNPRKLLGALIDAGVDVNTLTEEMKKLNIPFEMSAKKRERKKIYATDVELKTEERKNPTTLNRIVKLINCSLLKLNIKEEIKFIFNGIAEAESKVHGQPKEKVHLYEVGQPRAILYVAGIIVGLKKLKVDKIYCSEISLGCGKVKCSHGILSVPTPATSILIMDIPIVHSDIKGELTTPLGVAIISSLTKKFGKCPPMFIERIGQGFGTKDGPAPTKPLTIYTGSKLQ